MIHGTNEARVVPHTSNFWILLSRTTLKSPVWVYMGKEIHVHQIAYIRTVFIQILPVWSIQVSNVRFVGWKVCSFSIRVELSSKIWISLVCLAYKVLENAFLESLRKFSTQKEIFTTCGHEFWYWWKDGLFLGDISSIAKTHIIRCDFTGLITFIAFCLQIYDITSAEAIIWQRLRIFQHIAFKGQLLSDCRDT